MPHAITTLAARSLRSRALVTGAPRQRTGARSRRAVAAVRARGGGPEQAGLPQLDVCDLPQPDLLADRGLLGALLPAGPQGAAARRRDPRGAAGADHGRPRPRRGAAARGRGGLRRHEAMVAEAHARAREQIKATQERLTAESRSGRRPLDADLGAKRRKPSSGSAPPGRRRWARSQTVAAEVAQAAVQPAGRHRGGDPRRAGPPSSASCRRRAE